MYLAIIGVTRVIAMYTTFQGGTKLLESSPFADTPHFPIT